MARLPPTRARRALFKRPQAKKLRAEAQAPEKILWAALRAKRLAPLRFRRQQPIGPYIVDFYCSAAKLVIELDGSQHAERKTLAHDIVRTKWLEALGYRVLRFWNGDVQTNRVAVLEAILNTVEKCGVPLPEPPSAVRPSLKGRVEGMSRRG